MFLQMSTLLWLERKIGDPRCGLRTEKDYCVTERRQQVTEF